MDANHNCSIAFEITTSKQKSNLHMNGADHRVQAFPYHVWVCGEPQRRMELSCAFFFCWRINGEILIIKHYYYVNRS